MASAELKEKLNQAGLDAEYWTSILESKLMVNLPQQIQYLDETDLEIVEVFVRKNWEKKALRNFWGIKSGPASTKAEKEDLTQRGCGLIKNPLREVDVVSRAGIPCTDDTINSKLESVREFESTPRNQWSKQYGDKSSDSMIGMISSEKQDIVEINPMKTTKNILEVASGGLALKGILVGEAGWCIKRVALSTPTDAVLMNPTMQQIDEVVSFSSESQSDNFHQTLDSMGYSVVNSAKGGIWGLETNARISQEKEKEHGVVHVSDCHKHTQFESRVRYFVVPTALCKLNPHTLKLSREAVRDLIVIDRILEGRKNLGPVYKKCEDFLYAYGSHVNAGILHFGGVYKFVGTYTSDTKPRTHQVGSMVQDALSAYALADYSGSGFGVGRSVSANKLTTYGKVTNDYDKSELEKIKLQTHMNGGPAEVSGLALWKTGLFSSYGTWALIDRGESLLRDFVGIWELISNHRGEFQNTLELESVLGSVWEKMSGCKGSSDQEKGLTQSIDQSIEKNDRPNPHQSERCIVYPHKTRAVTSEAAAQHGANESQAEELCTETNMTSFLEKIDDQTDKFDPKDVSEIKSLLMKLVYPTGSKKETIMKSKANRPSSDVLSTPDIANIKTIPDLIEYLKERFTPAPQNQHANVEKKQHVSYGVNARATRDLAFHVGRLLKDLHSSKEPHEVCFLRVAMLPLGYHWPTETFGKPVTMEMLEEFTQSIEVSWKEFQVHRERGSVQLEGFLLHNLLTAGYFNERGESAEEEFSELIAELRQVLSLEVNTVLNRYATQSPFNWLAMRQICAELAEGKISRVQERELNVTDLEKITDSLNEHTEDGGPVKTADSEIGGQVVLKDILNMLGLCEYYPSKMSVSEAIAIKDTIGDPKLNDVPWIILKKLFMIDFHARDQPLLEVKNASNKDDSDEKDLEALIESGNIGGVGDESTCVSTLDALVAIFLCCDNFLKQIVAQKLFVCKLAIPFLYPLDSEGNIGMSLWALRTIIVQCHNNNKEVSETPVTEAPFPLVTFIRFGRPPISKSKLLNDILRDDSHDTFFHKDCDNGTEARRITDGLVECSWFLPAGKEVEYLPRTTMFLDLRGDAILMKSHLQILQEISNVIFVLVTADDLAKSPSKEACQRLLQTGVKVILLLMTSSEGQSTDELLCCFEAVGKDYLKGAPIILSNTQKGIKKNASELRTEARRKISEALHGCSGILLENCAQRAMNMGIVIDEYDDEACLEGRNLAKKASRHMEGKKLEDCRELLLPLQGVEWIEYSKLLKKQQRATEKESNESSEQYADQMKLKMDHLRKNQIEIYKKRQPPFLMDFISGLHKKHTVVMYFLKWMSLFLDEKSRSTLPGIRNKYHKSWTDFHCAKEDRDKEKLEELKSHVHNAEHKLAKASLGLENLFRELGQYYEAMKEGSKAENETRPCVDDLVEIVAALLLRGIPFELVDGDAASVPITWVCAVLKKVEDLIGEKKLYVVSVLGIQSSGKSTLLNTMFGLQFAVSAGRCTRGAYMQLIPVDEKAALPFDYIAVVDTEGLRAPELGQLKHEHDNELATLVIGLGDVTLINVKGENTAEIKDILQIAVHAFLRMIRVKRHIRDNRTCMFIHQNVPAANADEMMRHGCQKLKESLDDVTKEAAISQGIADIHSFSQIINFDIEKHVWYFSDLWHGNPPMAPANPGYSEKVNEVNLNLLGKIAEGKTFLTASELSIRLADLWNGVLAEDFVFSFRNSLEVKAYNSLQSKYYTLERELQNRWKSWSHDAEITLKRCESIEKLESSFRSLVVELPEVLGKKAEDIKVNLQTYFENCDLRHIVIQWRQSKMTQLEFATEEQQREGTTYLLSIKEARRVEIMHAKKWSKHQGYIMEKAVILADELKGKKASDEELKEKFNDMWVSMVNELATKTEDTELNMAIVMEDILNKRIHDQRLLIRDELRRNPLSVPPEQKSLESSINADFVSTGHISVKTTLLGKIKRTLTGSITPQEDARNRTEVLTGEILKDIGIDLRGLTHDMMFQNSYGTEIINKVVDRITSYNQEAQRSEKCSFTILPEYVVKLAVHVSRYCVQTFTLMQSEYIKRHGVKAKLQAYKATAWSLFTNTVKDATEEVVAGDLLCTSLREIVQKAVQKAAPIKCTDEILRDMQMTKYYMLLKIMDYLAREGNFDEYMSFIDDGKSFALNWLNQYTAEVMFSRQNPSRVSRYAEITKIHTENIIKCISESVSYATSGVNGQRGMKMTLWIKMFCDRVSKQIAVPIGDLSVISARKVKDFSNLERVVCEQLKNVQAALVNMFANVSPNTVDWHGKPPSQLVLDKIWGCCEQCPFCQEPCADTTHNHLQLGKAHMCVQHRPIGFAGTRWVKNCSVDGFEYKSQQLSHHSCNYSVQLQNVTFSCGVCRKLCRKSKQCSATDTEKIYHKYVEYKTFLPDWDIAPDRTNSVSKYWMWVMATYQHQLKDRHEAKLPDLPDSWMSVTKEEALADLRKIHH